MSLFPGRGDLICVPPARPKVNSGVGAGFMFQRRGGNQIIIFGSRLRLNWQKRDSDVVPDVVSVIRFKGISNHDLI
jgi:hypothetical protein